MSRWKVLKSKEITQAGFFRLRVDECELPDGRVNPRYYVFEYPDWVNIVPVTTDGKLVMIEQYRHGAGEDFLEIPGGATHGAGEDPKIGGARELREETGFEPTEWIYCGHQYPNPAMQSNKLHTFLALGCRKVGEPELDPFEDLKTVLMPVSEVYRKLDNAELTHSLIVSSLFFARKHLIERGLLAR